MKKRVDPWENTVNDFFFQQSHFSFWYNKPTIGTRFSKEGVMDRLTKSHVHVLYPQKHIIVYAKWIIAYKIVRLCVQLPILYTHKCLFENLALELLL